MKVNVTVVFTIDLDPTQVANPEALFVERADSTFFAVPNDEGHVCVAEGSSTYETINVEILAGE